MNLDMLLDIVYFGWIFNIVLWSILLLIVLVKTIVSSHNMTNEDLMAQGFQLELFTEQLHLRKEVLGRRLQVIISWIVPYYRALLAFIGIGYVLYNITRNVVDIILELDYVLDDYRIWRKYK